MLGYIEFVNEDNAGGFLVPVSVASEVAPLLKTVGYTRRVHFDSWMRDVDKMFYNIFCLAASDFEDWTWMEAYDLNKTPEQAFDKWAEESGHAEVI